jgi:hypothetical protein
MIEDDRDAWLDDVKRWYYGGTAPADTPVETQVGAPPDPKAEPDRPPQPRP